MGPPPGKKNYADESTREVAKSLKKSFPISARLSVKSKWRPKIGEWRNWLMSELQKCDYINNSLFKNIKADVMKKLIMKWLRGSIPLNNTANAARPN